MKLKLLFFIICFIPAVASAAKYTEFTKDGGKITDIVRDIRVCCKCSSSWADVRNVKQNVRAFCEFPNTTYCHDGTWKDYWTDCKMNMCDGYNHDLYKANPAAFKEVGQWSQNNTGGDKTLCWKWECNPGYVMLADSKNCILEADCRAMPGMDVSGGGCAKSNWCNDGWKRDFVALQHKQIKTGQGCHEFRCQFGAFTSSTDLTCVPISQNGEFGGSYPDHLGIIATCPKNNKLKITVSSNGEPKYECVASEFSITINDMQKCFRCSDPDDFESCVKYKGKKTQVDEKTGAKSAGTEFLECAYCTDLYDATQCWASK